jgi:hypothetical protein
MVRDNLRVAQSRQKSYADHRRRELSFEVGDFVYLKVSPMRGLHYFKVWGKLTPRSIGPFKVLEKRGEVAYQLELPPQLSDMHDVFHVSQLKKCLRVPKEQSPMEDLDAKEDLSYQEYSVKISKTSERVTQNKKFRMCKMQWSHHTEEKLLGKEKKNWRQSFQISFSIRLNLQNKIHIKDGRFVTPWFSQGNKTLRKIN